MTRKVGRMVTFVWGKGDKREASGVLQLSILDMGGGHRAFCDKSLSCVFISPPVFWCISSDNREGPACGYRCGERGAGRLQQVFSSGHCCLLSETEGQSSAEGQPGGRPGGGGLRMEHAYQESWTGMAQGHRDCHAGSPEAHTDL